MGGNIFKLLEKPASVDERKHWGTQERRKNKNEVRFGGTTRGSYKGSPVTGQSLIISGSCAPRQADFPVPMKVT